MIARIRAFLRSLQVDLAEREAAITVGRWWLINGIEMGHVDDCRRWGPDGFDADCSCGWTRTLDAFEVLSDLTERADGFGPVEVVA